ncbi:sigma-70 family RNA polymerase sigma factor [Marivita sp.]|jgi:RNA polymerase sigma-70 factor (ECF subfamily)|uniref:sigma-70 family RNA polymerase sigma factor n=1 Tax=Marivita sp. TaxID=2003365 RepID=UPI003F70717A
MIDHAKAIQDCAQGKHAGLQAIFEAEAPQLIGVAMRILRRRDLAEDAVQEAFVQVWTKAAQFDPDRGSGRGWVYTIVRHRALNILRDASREIPSEPAHLDAHVARDDAVTQSFDRLEETSALRTCLEQLNAVTRRCILMAYVLGYSHGEIAGRMDAPLGTTKSWITRGLHKLRECLS